MTREIKFRGKRLDNGEWLEGDLCTRLTPKGSMTTCPVIQTTCGTIGTWFVHPDTVGQFTSLKDRNGKEIYEGDIIRREGLPEIVAEVVYENGEFICVGHYRVNGGLGWMLKRGLQLEVIGNIHDNKELL